MVKQIPPDEWLCPGINYGCIIKFALIMRYVSPLPFGIPRGCPHPTMTSVREHKG